MTLVLHTAKPDFTQPVATVTSSTDVRASCQADTVAEYEILPLRDHPEPYSWTSPEEADCFTVYERGNDGLASAQVDVPTLNEALVYAQVRRIESALLWTGAMFVRVSPDPF